MKPWLETLCKIVLSRETRDPAESPESVAQMRAALRTLGCAFIDTTDDVDAFIAALIERCEQLEADRAHYAGDAGNDSCAAVLAERDQLKAELDRLRRLENALQKTAHDVTVVTEQEKWARMTATAFNPPLL